MLVVDASLRLRPPLRHCDQITSIGNLLTDLCLQEMLRRVPTSSRHDALNATLSVRARETRSVLTCTGCSDARLVLLMASHTPMPTRQRESPGITTLWYARRIVSRMWTWLLTIGNSSSTLRTRRSIFQARRWHSVD